MGRRCAAAARRPRRPGRVLLVVIVAVVAVALGFVALLVRAGATERAEYADALAAMGEAHGAAPGNSECFAEATVAAIGLDALEEIATADELGSDPNRTPRSWGISPDESQAEEFYDEVQGCIDTRQVYMDHLRDEGLAPDAVPCVEGALNDDLLRRFFVILWIDLESPLQADPDLRDDFRAALAPCVRTDG